MMATQTGCGIKLIVTKGAKGDGVAWRGEWSASTIYDYISAVSRGGSTWISKRNQNVGHDPLTDDGTWWDCMVRDSLAEAARDKAEKWANNPKNVPVEPGKYSAYHWSLVADEIGKAWAENPVGVPVKDGEYSAYHWAQVAQDIVYSAEVLQRLETMGGILI